VEERRKNQAEKTTTVHSDPPTLPAGEIPEVKDSRLLKAESLPAGLDDRWRVLGVCIFLAAIIWVVFGQTLGHGFVNYDDDLYVYENPAVTRGLNLKGVEWAFNHTVAANWHPLTMMSHMLDCQLYGLSPGGHHLTNILGHTATTILLFLVLRRMTGFLWRSALVAAVFAIHPLRVESVAWVAERKDVLSGLFFMLTLWAYGRYVQRQSRVESRGSNAPAAPALGPRLWTLDYCLVLLFFALGLMCKPMLVTLPLVLLLLDYWPLNRFAPLAPAPAVTGKGGALKNHSVRWRLILEKIPLLALTGAACVVTMVTQKDIIVPAPLALRIGNAVVSCVVYLRQMVYPAGLAVLYPYPRNSLSGWEITLAVVLLVAISAGVFLRWRKEPYLLVGWLWYLGMLVPVIGLVQAGAQARADRYTYLPQIGLYLAIIWAVGDMTVSWRYRRQTSGVATFSVIAALMVCAWKQTTYWQSNESLWTHTLACTSDNAFACNNLGDALLQKGEVDKAITLLQRALQINPDCAYAHNGLGNALLQKGEVDEAIAQYQKELQIYPDGAYAHNNLGNVLLQKGEVDEAIAQYQKALQINPDNAEVHNHLVKILFQRGNVDEAIAHCQRALQIDPDNAEAHNNLGNVLLQKGDVDGALAQYQKALQIKPDSVEAHSNLGNALLQKGELDEAIAQYQEALRLSPDNAAVRNNLDRALLQKGRVDKALASCQKALQNKPDSSEVLNNLAWLLATCPDAHVRDGVRAVKYAERACELTHHRVTVFVGTLAAAYAEAGRFDEAMAAAQEACALATAAGERELLAANQKLLVLYRAHQPYHEAAGEYVPAAP
jgi:tetratricopeptide (TPR) repeat protein